MTIDELQDLIERHAGRTKQHADGEGFDAHCPGPRHKRGDRNRSLSVDPGDNASIVMKCHTGCETSEIMAALGCKLSDLYPPAERKRRGGRGTIPRRQHATLQPSPASTGSNDTQGLQQAAQPDCNPQPPAAGQEPGQDALLDAPSEGCSLAAYAVAKRLPIGALRMYGLSEITYQNAPAVRIPYRDRTGRERSVRFRIEPAKRADGSDNRFRWRSGSKTMLYGLWRLDEERRRGHAEIALVEGESDCHTLWYHGLPAVGIPGADTWQDGRDALHLEDFDTIYVVVEPDTGGEAVKKWLGTSTIRERVRLVNLGAHKDTSGLYLADPGHFKERWQAAIAAAVPWVEREAQEHQQLAASAWAICSELAKKPDILAAFAEAITSDGVVGEERTVKLIYLAVTSRLLDSVVSLVLKGPSSAGKSYTTERVLRYFPDAAFYALSAMSERSLAYSDEPIAHRMLVFYEAAGIRGDFATYLLRTLLSEGCIRYDTVEKTPEGMRPRQIVRPGPAGALITTTEVSLHAENETRMLSVPVTDTPEQTRRILRAQATEDRAEPGRDAWHALQTWLAGSEHRVTIPYAAALAALIPPVAVRLRRDFPAVLNLIRAHALLHQATRQKDAKGRIMATLGDYDAVRALVYDLISDGVEATVPATVRETVAAVAGIVKDADTPETGATIAQVAKHLKLDKSAAQRRVQTAIKNGYLRNLEERKGHAAQLVIGDPMPDDVIVLPTVAVLQEGCSDLRNPEVPDNSGVDSSGCSVAGVTAGVQTSTPTDWDEVPA